MQAADTAKAQLFQIRLFEWYAANRRRFDWRSGRNSAYEILIAELMLRKTDAAKVQRVYRTFLSRFPTVQALADADEQDIRSTIQLLGIADRARLMKLTAQTIASEHRGRIPDNYDHLIALPGVGAYTANAVICFAYRKSAPLVDTNVIRLLERVFSLTSERARAREDPVLWHYAAGLVPARRAVQYNRALLDLAALICTRTKPRCEGCPLQAICDYAQSGVGREGTARER